MIKSLLLNMFFRLLQKGVSNEGCIFSDRRNCFILTRILAADATQKQLIEKVLKNRCSGINENRGDEGLYFDKRALSLHFVGKSF